MYILGIDPGTGRTGWGVIKQEENGEVVYVAHGCVTTSQDFLMHERLLTLYDELQSIVKVFSPTCMVVEQIFFGMNSRTAISVSQARGVIMLIAAHSKLPFFEYTSISVKHYLSGNGRMEKKDMQDIVRKLLSKNKITLPFSTKDKAFDDSADALAIAIHHAWKSSGFTPEHMKEKVAKLDKGEKTKREKREEKKSKALKK